MLSIKPDSQSGASPLPPSAKPLAKPLAPPIARAMPVPPNAGRNHKTDLGDYITLGIGVAGVGALGVAAAGGLEAVTVGGALLAKNAQIAAKAFTPKLVDDWKAGAERLKSATEVGRVAAEQTTAALTDYARGAIVGAGISGASALAEHVVHAVEPHADWSASRAPSQCRPRL